MPAAECPVAGVGHPPRDSKVSVRKQANRQGCAKFLVRSFSGRGSEARACSCASANRHTLMAHVDRIPLPKPDWRFGIPLERMASATPIQMAKSSFPSSSCSSTRLSTTAEVSFERRPCFVSSLPPSTENSTGIV